MVWVMRTHGGHRRRSTRYSVRKEFFPKDTGSEYVDPDVLKKEREEAAAAKAKRAQEIIRKVKQERKPKPKVYKAPAPKPKKEPEIVITGYRVELEYNPPADSYRGWDSEYEQRAKEKER